MPAANALPHNAGCNPPRKAKRPRTDAETAQTQTDQPLQQHAWSPMFHRDVQPFDDEEDEDDDYDPDSPPPAPQARRRARKSGLLSRSARESQHKLKHSRIEKARRTKINEALATLRTLVREAEEQRGGSSDAEERAKKPEKEFKLDVLIKAVAYIQELIQRVKTLESRASSCPHCSAPSGPVRSPTRKRKVSDLDVDDSFISAPVGEVDRPDSPLSPLSPLVKPASESSPVCAQSMTPSQPPTLPPISSWLSDAYIDPGCLSSALSSAPPNGPPSRQAAPPLPRSSRAPGPLAAFPPPALVIPGPAHPQPMPSPSITAETSRMHISTPKRRMSAAHAAGVTPTVSPSWTPADELAASLLLSMSSSPNSTSSRLRGNSLDSNGARS